MEVNEIKRSLKAQKGHLTRSLKSAMAAVDFLKKSPSANAKSELERCLQKVQIAKDKVQNWYARLMELDMDNEQAYSSKLDQVEDEYLQVIEVVMEQIHAYADLAAARPLNAAPAQQAGGQRQQQCKIQLALKPDKLTRESTPAELRSWIEKFRSFYSLSNLQIASVRDQQNCLFQCLDMDLEVGLRQEINENTAIFDDDGCIEKLEEKFKVTYPLFTRRLDFFRHQQAKGQTFADFYARLRQKGDEAELADLTVDHTYVFRIICACSDQKLKEKFLKLESPTLEDLVKEAELYEVARRSMREFNKGDNGQNGSAHANARFVKTQDLKGKC
jgi:hypothetical protein